ncbi:MFS transporter [Puniceicoccaceae bacterium K14]|nr:MFS transporter [Puniceicoccaceae bacterium K14]
MTCAPFMILVGGLLGAQLAPSSKLATLPVAAMILGSALFTGIAVYVLKRLGRKRGSYVGIALALVGTGLGMCSTLWQSFNLLLGAAFLLGVSLAFAQQYRFAALESLSDKSNFGLALSVMMAGGILSAFVGPEIGSLGKNWLFPEHDFLGSFVLLAGVIALGGVVFSLYRATTIQVESRDVEARPLIKIIRNPVFVVSIIASSVSYGVMSLVMTATPVNMYELCGYELSDTKEVIQNHIMAMFLPSLIGGFLMKRMGIGGMMLSGGILYAIMMVVALQGSEYMHFNGALLALGVGWNFLFISGTALLPRSYRPEERFKVQATNDVVVFSIQAIGSLGAGWLLFQFGWNTLVWICVVPIFVAMLASTWFLIKKPLDE